MFNHPGIRLFCAGIFLSLSANQVLAQNQSSQAGMTVSNRNYTSFPQQVVGNSDLWKSFNAPKDYDHPEFGILPKDAPCTNCVEDLSKRTVDERYFIDLEDPSKFYIQKALGDLHLQHQGDWVSIDHALQAKDDGIYESRFDFEPAGIRTHLKDAYIQTPEG